MDEQKQKKTKTDEEPYEEFRDEGLTTRDDREEERPKDKENYREWTLEQLQHEAQRRGMEESMEMDKEKLIRKLKGD